MIMNFLKFMEVSIVRTLVMVLVVIPIDHQKQVCGKIVKKHHPKTSFNKVQSLEGKTIACGGYYANYGGWAANHVRSAKNRDAYFLLGYVAPLPRD